MRTKKLISMEKSDALELERLRAESGLSQSQIIRDLMRGKMRFISRVEEAISDYEKARSVSRSDAIQSLIIEALTLKGRKE